jgi:hypothetical protein
MKRWFWPIVAAAAAFWAGRATGQAALMQELKEQPPELPKNQTSEISETEQDAVIDLVESAPGSFAPAQERDTVNGADAADAAEFKLRTVKIYRGSV